MKKPTVLLLTVCLLAGHAYAYGPRGHSLVGAVADRRLKATNKAAAARVSQLLDGLTLEAASTLPDEIKSWDDCSRPPSKNPVNASKRVNDELRAFVKANPCGGHPSHHEFHYTDVPVFGGEEYHDGSVGRSDFDIVQMIPFCVRVLRGDEPETNDRRITKTVAVILLAHYLGDIHQPLHVGAEYFNSKGKPFEPNPNNEGFADQGGNKLTLFLLTRGKLRSAGKFHGYWDSQTVDNAFGKSANSTVARQLANKTPAKWKLPGGAETWAEQLADEALPLAREAHERLNFTEIKLKPGDRDITSGHAEERKKTGGRLYATWSAGVVRSEIHRAGWRLAALLEEVLQ